MSQKYVYESPDGGRTIYRRNQGNFDLRRLIKENPNNEELGRKIRQWYFDTSKHET